MFQEGLKTNSFIVIGEGKKCFRRFVTRNLALTVWEKVSVLLIIICVNKRKPISGLRGGGPIIEKA